MAAIGILLAISSALVGATRTELIATMVEQTNTAGQYQTVSTKHRILQTNLRRMHARLPKEKAPEPEEKAKTGDPAAASVVELVRFEGASVLGAVTPVQDDVDQFAWLVLKFKDQLEAAEKWTRSFDATIETQKVAAEQFEWAQILAELGIVLSSVALLFRSRVPWLLSVMLGVGSLVIVSWTWVDTNARLERSERLTVEASRRFVALSSEAADQAADEDLVKEIEEALK
jgi:hypothetical protein